MPIVDPNADVWLAEEETAGMPVRSDETASGGSHFRHLSRPKDEEAAEALVQTED